MRAPRPYAAGETDGKIEKPIAAWIVVARGALSLLRGSSFFLCTVGNVLWTRAPVKSEEGAVRENSAPAPVYCPHGTLALARFRQLCDGAAGL